MSSDQWFHPHLTRIFHSPEKMGIHGQVTFCHPERARLRVVGISVGRSQGLHALQPGFGACCIGLNVFQQRRADTLAAMRRAKLNSSDQSVTRLLATYSSRSGKPSNRYFLNDASSMNENCSTSDSANGRNENRGVVRATGIQAAPSAACRSNVATRSSSRSADVVTFTWRMLLPVPSSRPVGSSSVAPL